MKSSTVGLVISFLIGSAATVLFFSWNQHEVASVPSVVNSTDANTEARLAFANINQRLSNIESQLTRNSQKQAESQNTTPTELNATNRQKSEGKPSVDIAARTAALQAGNAIVERAMQNGTVTQTDMITLISAGNLNVEDRQKLLSRITVAINKDQLKFDPNQ